MAWPNPFRRRDENTRDAWGHIFQWTPDHQSPEDYNHLKYSYDNLGEDCLNILNEICPPPSRETAPPQVDSDGNKLPPPAKRDLYALLRDNRTKNSKLQELWDQVSNVPEWVDWDQISRGQEIFYRYGGATLTGLAFQSLLGGMGANRVVEVLARTGGFNIKVARGRLLETTQHILECTKSLESIQPGGDGFASSLRVRLLHAAVRQRIMKLVETHPTYYSVEKYGVPINDFDCIGTISVFSATTVFLSLPRQGIFLSHTEITDYVALWRLIAHYTGTPTDPFSSAHTAKLWLDSLAYFELNPSPTSVILANNVIRALENTPPSYASREFLEVSARWLNGNKLSDALGLGRPSWYYWVLMSGQCLFFMALCYTYRSIPALDKRKIAALRRIFWHIIVENKEMGMGGATSFEFKFVPEVGKVTGKEGDGDEEERKNSEEQKEKILWKGVERRSLRTLMIAGVVMGGMAWVGLKIGIWAFGVVVG